MSRSIAALAFLIFLLCLSILPRLYYYSTVKQIHGQNVRAFQNGGPRRSQPKNIDKKPHNIKKLTQH